jgi:hypothetical protein
MEIRIAMICRVAGCDARVLGSPSRVRSLVNAVESCNYVVESRIKGKARSIYSR